jgi:hypothetical protein
MVGSGSAVGVAFHIAFARHAIGCHGDERQRWVAGIFVLLFLKHAVLFILA